MSASSAALVMSKDILALIKQGMEAKTGTSHGTLLTRREEAIQTEIIKEEQRQYSLETAGKHRVLFITKSGVSDVNKLLYNIAAYNFSRFMVKDFDLAVSKLDSVQTIISVTNFESYGETEWYVTSIAEDVYMTELLSQYGVDKVIISEVNFGMMKSLFGLDEYRRFQPKILAMKKNMEAKAAVAKPITKPVGK
jgi:hypothetical protein